MIMKIIKWLAYLVVALAVIFVGGSFFLPNEASVSRSIEIAAPADKIFPIVGDLKRNAEFTVWAKADPETKYTYEGPAIGVGQKVSWQSDHPQVGSGSQTVTAWEENKVIDTSLDFGDMGTATAAFQLETAGAGTKVTWDFHTKMEGMMQKWFGLMFDRWIGDAYNQGLENLKKIAESS